MAKDLTQPSEDARSPAIPSVIPLAFLGGMTRLACNSTPFAASSIRKFDRNTKQEAEYLSMSEWKLRRLIQDAIIPFFQDHEGGPFLLDVRDLDA